MMLLTVLQQVAACTCMIEKTTLLCVVIKIFPGCCLEKDLSGGSVNQVCLSTINPKFYSFPPPVKPAQVRNTQRENTSCLSHRWYINL